MVNKISVLNFFRFQLCPLFYSPVAAMRRWNEKRHGECSSSMSEEKITELDILTYNEATAERLTTIGRLRRAVTSPAEATKDSLSSTCEGANRTVNQKPLGVEILLHFLSTRESPITSTLVFIFFETRHSSPSLSNCKAILRTNQQKTGLRFPRYWKVA